MDFIRLVPYLIIAILILLAMITIHEFGHYLAGKLLKFKINEFSVGFGSVIGIPRVWDKEAMRRIKERKARIKAKMREPVPEGQPAPQAYTAAEIPEINRDYLFRLQWANKSGEKISIRWFPLGGYCAFPGEDDASTQEDSFNNHKPWKRVVVFFSGAFFNIVSAIFFSMIYIAVIGFGCPVVGKVYDTSPNYGILQSGDVITGVDGKSISALNSFQELIGSYKEGDSFVLTINRSGSEMTASVSVGKYTSIDETSGEQLEHMGFGIYIPDWQVRKHGFFSTIGLAFPFTGKLCLMMLSIFGQIFTGGVPISELGGPVTTVRTIGEMTQSNFSTIFILLPLIAVNLGVFNLLPIPALDGSKIVFTVIEWIRRKPINRNIEAMIHFCGLVLLLGLVLFLDIINSLR